jgi:3-oxoacyl-[acyl-carrier protein] reductase
VSRTAVVTGAARGLGAAIAKRLAADGDRVLLVDVNLEGAEEVAAEVGGTALEHDVGSLESWERLLVTAGGADVLVNNAARTEIRPFFEIDADAWDDVLATNLRGTYLGIRVIGAPMRDRGSGRIVNLASVAGPEQPRRHRCPLRDLEGRDHRADAARRDRARRHRCDGERRRAGGDRRPDGRDGGARAARGDAEDDPRRPAGRPEEVAAAVAYLASDAAGFVTRATLDINGGILMR